MHNAAHCLIVLHTKKLDWMTLVAYVVVLTVALPYWAMVGEPWRFSPRAIMGGGRSALPLSGGLPFCRHPLNADILASAITCA